MRLTARILILFLLLAMFGGRPPPRPPRPTGPSPSACT